MIATARRDKGRIDRLLSGLAQAIVTEESLIRDLGRSGLQVWAQVVDVCRLPMHWRNKPMLF